MLNLAAHSAKVCATTLASVVWSRTFCTVAHLGADPNPCLELQQQHGVCISSDWHLQQSGVSLDESQHPGCHGR